MPASLQPATALTVHCKRAMTAAFSQVLAERAAWRLAEEEGLDLVTILREQQRWPGHRQAGSVAWRPFSPLLFAM